MIGINLILYLLALLLALHLLQLIKARFFPGPQSEEGFFSYMPERTASIAHRGSSSSRPENTIKAFTLGLREGAVGLELDIRLTADRQVVVFHDESLDRITEASGQLEDYSLEELQQLDAGYNFKAGNEYPFRGMGYTIPSLREVLKAFPQTPIIIEIKREERDIIPPLRDDIRSTEAENRVAVATEDDKTIKRLRKDAPEIVTGMARKEGIIFYLLAHLGLAGWMNWSFDGLFIPPSYGRLPLLTLPLRRAARATGLPIFLWTINCKEAMQRCLDLKIDGIITDYPDRLEQLL